MAVTNVTSRPPVVEDPDRAASDEVGVRKRTAVSKDGGSDSKCGSSKHPGERTHVLKLSRCSSTGSVASYASSDELGQNFDAEAYLDKRVMTLNQERFNAVTMLPGMIYSIYFILAGCWIIPGDQQEGQFPSRQNESSQWADMAREALGNEHSWIENIGCINSQALPYLTALPPLPVFAAAIGLLVHSPFSMLYHWRYASWVDSSKRVQHWSRRLDNAFIHFASACASYATSGRMDYFVLNAIFNLDCAYRQFEEEVRPKRNQVRIATSILLYLLPVLVYGHYTLFLQFMILFGVGGWLFVGYPVAGWSHGLFHLMLAFLPHLVMTASMQLESSQLQISLAAKCAGMDI
ncbi:hypothetical protein ACHAXR_010443 [Thalassiosira sp. AJA248-18]